MIHCMLELNHITALAPPSTMIFRASFTASQEMLPWECITFQAGDGRINGALQIWHLLMGQYKTWTLNWTMDWTLDSIMDSIFGLEFWLPGVRGHAKLLNSKIFMLLNVVSSSSVCCRDNEIPI